MVWKKGSRQLGDKIVRVVYLTQSDMGKGARTRILAAKGRALGPHSRAILYTSGFYDPRMRRKGF